MRYKLMHNISASMYTHTVCVHTHSHLKYESLKVKSSLLPLIDQITGHDDVTSKKVNCSQILSPTLC